MFVKNAEITVKELGNGVARKILATGGQLMAVEVHFTKGAIGALHAHPHEQISYVLKGRFEATIGSEKTSLTIGDTYYVPPDVVHGVTALEEGILLDIFTPPREDFLR